MYTRVYIDSMMANITEIRELFPALSRKVYGKGLVYLDNAATSQRPQSVLDKWQEISAYSNANIHRAVHRLSDEATQPKSSLDIRQCQSSSQVIFLADKFCKR